MEGKTGLRKEGAPQARHILSLGAGINSTALMIWLIQNEKPLDEAVFADTGGEVPETYQTVRKARAYLKARKIPLRTVKANGTLYDRCWRRKVIPSQIWRWSTRDFKVKPIHRYYKSLKAHIYQYIGIAYDEIHRMKDSREPYVTNLYPLVDEKLTRDDCIEVIKEAGFPMPVRSGCFFCPFNSTERWVWLYENHPRLYRKAVNLEEHSKHFPRQRLVRPTLRVLTDQIKKGKSNGERAEDPCGAQCMT